MIGTRLGPYAITAKLGEGGMGEVFRAHDDRLKRDVAIKVLPAAFTADAERLARFEREAQLLAQLHHPNIASLFGLEEGEGVRGLVMELVEGEDLAAVLARGRLPLPDALAIARQIAEALEEAHAKGIVHRDLKPQNVKVTPEGRAKVLDFGLAKAMDSVATGTAAASPSQLAQSPTLTLGATVQGMILGTAAYMAPEQARGLAADRRSDIWAFGVVLWEMLAGRRLFSGELVSDVLAGVLRQEIPWQALPAATPSAVRTLLRRCLERNPRRRLHDIADARIVLEEVLDGGGEETAPPAAGGASAAPRALGPRRLLAAVLGAAALGVALGFLLPRHEAPPELDLRFPLALPAGWKLADADTPLVALSRDGRRRAVAAIDAAGHQALFLGENDRIDWRELPATDGARAPFFSPDGHWVGYFDSRQMLRIAIDGGPPLPIAPVGNQVRGAVWLPDGTIVYSPDSAEPLFRVRADGGAPQPLTTIDAGRKERTHRWPDALPDGRAVLFTSDTTDTTESYDDATIEAVVIATGERKPLVRGACAARYLDPGVLLYARGGSLFAVRFDSQRLEVSGSPVPVLDHLAVTTASGAAQLGLSGDGTLLWIPGAAQTASDVPAFFDLDGTMRAPLGSVGGYGQVALSPDGKLLAATSADGSQADLWVLDLVRGGRSRLTFEGDVEEPTWSADGRRIAYTLTRPKPESGSAIYWRPADGRGEAELLVGGAEQTYPGSFSPDGRWFVFDRIPKGVQGSVIFVLDLATREAPRPLPMSTHTAEFNAEISPDGRFLAYGALESRGPEVFIRPFPSGSGKWQVSRSGGIEPHWSADGRTLYYRNGGALFRVPIDGRAELVVGTPARIAGGFRTGDSGRSYAPTPDGRGFIALPGHVLDDESSRLNLAFGWRREVLRRLDGR